MLQWDVRKQQVPTYNDIVYVIRCPAPGKGLLPVQARLEHFYDNAELVAGTWTISFRPFLDENEEL